MATTINIPTAIVVPAVGCGDNILIWPIGIMPSPYHSNSRSNDNIIMVRNLSKHNYLHMLYTQDERLETTNYHRDFIRYGLTSWNGRYMDMDKKPMMCFRPEIGNYVHVSGGGPCVIIAEYGDAYDIIPHDNEETMQVWTVPKYCISQLDPESFDVEEGRSPLSRLSGKIVIDGVEETDSQRPPEYVLRFMHRCLRWAYKNTRTYRLSSLQIISTSTPLFTGTVDELYRLRQSGEYTTTVSSGNNLYNGLDADAASRLLQQDGQGMVGTSMESDDDVDMDDVDMDDIYTQDMMHDVDSMEVEDINDDDEEEEEEDGTKVEVKPPFQCMEELESSNSNTFPLMVIPNRNLKSPITSLNHLEDITERNESLANQTLGPNDTDSFPLLDDDALMSAIEPIAIPYSQDVTGNHHSPIHHSHLKFYLKGQLVLQTGGKNCFETYKLLSSAFPFGSRTKMKFALQKYYPGRPLHPDQSTNTHLLMGVLKVEYCPFWLWKSQAGWIGNGLDLAQSLYGEVRELQNEESHWSNLQSHYSTSNTDALDLLVDRAMMKFMRGRSLMEMALFNSLSRAARTLKVNYERTHTMSTSIVANNDEGLSASADDVVQCLSDALLSIDTGRLAQVLPSSSSSSSSSSSADPNDVLGYVSIYKEMLHEIATLKNLPDEMKIKKIKISTLLGRSKTPLAQTKLWILCTNEKLFETHLKMLMVIVRRVFSAKDEDELRLILSRIWWNASNAKQQDSFTSVVEQCLPSGHDDIRTQIDSFLFTSASEDDIFGPKQCVRHGCTRFAAQSSDISRRSYSNSLCCNDETCSRTCTWYENGTRCSAPRWKGLPFCGSTKCKTLHRGSESAFKQELQARKDRGEKFVASGSG